MSVPLNRVKPDARRFAARLEQEANSEWRACLATIQTDIIHKPRFDALYIIFF